MTSVAPERAAGAAVVDVVDEAAPAGRTPRQIFWARFKEDRLAFIGLGFIAALILLAVCAPLIARLVGHGPNELFQREMTDEFGLPKGPTGSFIFGADSVGRDVFVRVVYGTRTSLLIAFVATGIATFIGVTLGMLAGYFKGVVDTIIARSIDVLLSMPLLLLAIGIGVSCAKSKQGCLGGLIQPGLGPVIFIIALFSWPYIARIVRGQVLSIREREFIDSARALGAGHARIMFREVLPNLVAPIIVYATLIIPNNIIFESALSFLGVGVPQNIPSWGRMLANGADLIEVAWWLMVFPGLFLLFTTLAFNLVGDGLRDALDPRTRR